MNQWIIFLEYWRHTSRGLNKVNHHAKEFQILEENRNSNSGNKFNKVDSNQHDQCIQKNTQKAQDTVLAYLLLCPQNTEHLWWCQLQVTPAEGFTATQGGDVLQNLSTPTFKIFITKVVLGLCDSSLTLVSVKGSTISTGTFPSSDLKALCWGILFPQELKQFV